MKIKISLISTVLNEEKVIKYFINSIVKQTKKPDEFIIVDGGSKDKTYKILKEISKNHYWIKVYQKIGANISEGRNYAIKKSKNGIIVVCDSGTIYKKDWLEKLIKEFKEKNADVGFGKTLPLTKTKFQKILAKSIKQRFGSSRNIIFKKRVWEKIGGYPEDLRIGEDTLFNERIKKQNFNIILIPNAIGYWEMRNNLNDFKKQFYNYGYWDGIAYKKYHLLPLHHKIAVLGITILIPFYPIFFILSLFSLSIKVKLIKRINYVLGFWNGVLRSN
jgi:glycosyltransferase involved in cell wall biosynthesis